MTSVAGTTTHGISQGHGSRNLLAMELVMTSGEIMQFGSLGSGAGWFSSNGPGPSLRGIVRGTVGANGGLGVFTRCAMRLNPWYGPGELKVKGNSPYYEGEVPENFVYHVLEWPTWEQYAEAMYKIGRAKIAFAVHKTSGPGTAHPVIHGCNNDYWAARQAGELPLPLVSAGIVMAASSKKEHEYQVKALDAILKDTGGSVFEQWDEPQRRDRDYLNMVRACFIPRLAYRFTGSFSVDGIVGLDSIDNCALGNKLDDTHSGRFRERGAIVNDGTNGSWATCFDNGHFAITECGQSFDPLSEESRAGLEAMVEAGTKISIETPINLGTSPNSGAYPIFGPICGNYHIWAERIKRSYDPESRFGGAAMT
jgi:glycolate oxidase